MDDSTEFTETFNAMKAVTFKGKEIEATLKLVAIVLHMSNVSFQPQSIDGAEGCAVRDAAALDLVCSIAQVDRARLEHCLTYRQLQTMAPGGKIETYEVPMNPTQASASRDAIAKTIYSRLFDYLVQRVNDALVDAGDMTGVDDTYTIGVLDIYGFEIFKKNGFEQLCINYVNGPWRLSPVAHEFFCPPPSLCPALLRLSRTLLLPTRGASRKAATNLHPADPQG